MFTLLNKTVSAALFCKERNSSNSFNSFAFSQKPAVDASSSIWPLLSKLDHCLQVHYIHKAGYLELNGVFLLLKCFLDYRRYPLFIKPPATVLGFVEPTVSRFLQIWGGKFQACRRFENTVFRNRSTAKGTDAASCKHSLDAEVAEGVIAR